MLEPSIKFPPLQDSPNGTLHPGGLALTRQVLTYCDPRPDARILDVGCGAGTTLNALTAGCPLKGFGVDVSREGLLRARCAPANAASFAQACCEGLPIANECIDVILSECTLSLFESDRALQECARTLIPGGTLIIHDLYVRNEHGLEDLRRLPEGTPIRASLPMAQIRDILACHGFQVLAWQDCSELLKKFPVCAGQSEAGVEMLDGYVAAAHARLGYYFLVARKAWSGGSPLRKIPSHGKVQP